MADDGSAHGQVWPLPKFFFLVESDSLGACHFQEVSGLDTESEVLEYRDGDSSVFSSISMPGTKQHIVTLKKGILEGGDTRFYDWFGEIKINVIKRETLTIKLLDETGTPTMVWTVKNAWPVKLSGTDLKSEGNEVAIETLEIAHEGIEIQNI
ncbi:MAG: phage tail protein [Rhodothermales bacterium]